MNKKRILLLVVFGFVTSFANNTEPKKPIKNKTARLGEILVAGLVGLGGNKIARLLITKKKIWLFGANKDYVEYGFTAGGLLLGYVLAYFEFLNPQTAAGIVKLVYFGGNCSNEKLLKELSSLRDGDIQGFVMQLIAGGGHKKALQNIKKLEKERIKDDDQLGVINSSSLSKRAVRGKSSFAMFEESKKKAISDLRIIRRVRYLIEKDAAWTNAKKVLDGHVANPLLLKTIKSNKKVDIGNVINSSEPYSFVKALERLDKLFSEIKNAETSLLGYKGGDSTVYSNKIIQAKTVITRLASEIRKDKQFLNQKGDKMFELQKKTKYHNAKNKAISLKNEQEKLKKETEQAVIEKERYQKERVALERDVEVQKNKAYTTKLLLSQERTKVANALEREEQAKRKLKRYEDGVQKKSFVSFNRVSRQVQKNKKQIKENAKEITKLKEAFGSINAQPSMNPDYQSVINHEDQAASCPEQ